jgi:hypothetical protein
VAERKKRGLGRGLGALIPDANSNERPVDVFDEQVKCCEASRGQRLQAGLCRQSDPTEDEGWVISTAIALLRARRRPLQRRKRVLGRHLPARFQASTVDSAIESPVTIAEIVSSHMRLVAIRRRRVEDDVRETHPGVYTSSGRDQERRSVG